MYSISLAVVTQVNLHRRVYGEGVSQIMRHASSLSEEDRASGHM
jgi:hypothetical protein